VKSLFGEQEKAKAYERDSEIEKGGNRSVSVICNKVEESLLGEQEKAKAYERDSEKHIESGSAYFAQAFAEALGLVSDVELHDPHRAELRLRSMDILIIHALKEYDKAGRIDTQTGLTEYHERALREAGLDFEGVRRVLLEAGQRDLLSANEQLVDSVAKTFDQEGYQGLMNLYLDKVHSLHSLIGSAAVAMEDRAASNGVAWQELGWKLITLFSQAHEVGQAIAVLNTFTYRISLESRQV
jgi:hypothetical protein